MKKIFALLLVVVMMMGLATVASAVTGYADSEPTSFNIKKTYASDEEFLPGETLNFTVTADSNNPCTEDKHDLVVGTNNTFAVVADDEDQAFEIPVAIPSYDEVGEYHYTIEETAGNTAGVEYDTATKIKVVVLVGYDNAANKLAVLNSTYIMYQTVNGAEKKVDTFENDFNTYDFTVDKKVTGNMANKDDEFDIVVTLTSTKEILTPIKIADAEVLATEWTKGENAWTYEKTLTLSHNDDAVGFENIPDDVTVLVTEEDKQLGYTKVSIDNDGVVTSASVDKAITVTNNKDASVDTGIAMDSMPFVVMLVVAAFGLVAFTAKKRVQE